MSASGGSWWWWVNQCISNKRSSSHSSAGASASGSSSAGSMMTGSVFVAAVLHSYRLAKDYVNQHIAVKNPAPLPSSSATNLIPPPPSSSRPSPAAYGTHLQTSTSPLLTAVLLLPTPPASASELHSCRQRRLSVDGRSKFNGKSERGTEGPAVHSGVALQKERKEGEDVLPSQHPAFPPSAVGFTAPLLPYTHMVSSRKSSVRSSDLQESPLDSDRPFLLESSQLPQENAQSARTPRGVLHKNGVCSEQADESGASKHSVEEGDKSSTGGDRRRPTGTEEDVIYRSARQTRAAALIWLGYIDKRVLQFFEKEKLLGLLGQAAEKIDLREDPVLSSTQDDGCVRWHGDVDKGGNPVMLIDGYHAWVTRFLAFCFADDESLIDVMEQWDKKNPQRPITMVCGNKDCVRIDHVSRDYQ
eukprot:GHVS01089926.1.p1 GENE.GHVS01089926.1~~GHVS01089926.1.p1  ORF type:complete len:416 (-),score=70.88 GHVS01089926.1:235-1482(-)